MDLSKVTACGESCEACGKKLRGLCPGCIEADGYVPEWKDSGRCRVHACARDHGARFCGVCREFPCKEMTALIYWKPDVEEHMRRLAQQIKEE